MTIIKSLLWQDYYKITMPQVILHQAPTTTAKYRFKCRNGNALPHTNQADNETFVEEIRQEIEHLCSLKFQQNELDFLASRPYFTPDYIEILKHLQLNKDYIHVGIKDNKLDIWTEGSMFHTMWFEVFVLLITSTKFNEHRADKPDGFNLEQEAWRRLKDKITWLKAHLHPDSPFIFADFGTRRAWSPEWHEKVVQYLIKELPGIFIGTSNVYLAMKYGLTPIGTMAHEYFQAWQQIGPRLEDCQKAALQAWADEYRGENGIALSDTLGFDVFLKDFDRYFALLFDGCRHDSGDPAIWAEKLINHYKTMRIDPRTKQAVFSDGLTFPIAVDLFNKFHGQIKTSFGIGTYLTNDVGPTALQLVMKMVECNNRPVAKISDSKGKGMCEDEGFLTYLKDVCKRRLT